MGLTRVTALVAALLTALACVKEIELPATTTSALFVDGSVVVDSANQTLVLGRTDGLRARGTPILDASVEVVDITADIRHIYTGIGEGRYAATYVGQRGHAYRLEVDIPGVGRYRSRADSLAALPLTVTGEATVLRELGRDDEDIVTNVAATALSIVNESGDGAAGVLTVRPAIAWSFFDQVCDPFDDSDQCWYVEADPTEAFTVIDLSLASAAGDTAVAFVGPQPIDFRLAEVAYLISDIRRRSPASAPYFTALAQALNPTGSPFDEQPRPVTGNIEGDAGAESVLGFFGVTESLPVYAPTAGNVEIRSRSSGRLCTRGRDVPQRFNCCFCDQGLGASTERPPYLP